MGHPVYTAHSLALMLRLGSQRQAWWARVGAQWPLVGEGEAMGILCGSRAAVVGSSCSRNSQKGFEERGPAPLPDEKAQGLCSLWGPPRLMASFMAMFADSSVFGALCVSLSAFVVLPKSGL